MSLPFSFTINTLPSHFSQIRRSCFIICDPLNDSFYRSEFQEDKFLSLAEAMTNKLLICSDEMKMNTFKASVIASFVRKLSVILSLSKTQNEQILSFWKTMIIFIEPRNEEISKKIHASYSTCLRQCLKDELVGKRLCQQYMKECSHFSIAVDSALIRREHVLSCFARFAIKETFIQIPVFFTVCHVETGEDLALFMMAKLDEHGAEFQKLVSVTTDGAANMNGKYSGMSACLKRLVRQRCATAQVHFDGFHSVWCFAHRVNLVTRDFMCLKGVNIVKSFADWFADRRRQVSYKTFLSGDKSGSKLKSIPQPSDTRWLFYRDVISAILSQRKHVEEFLMAEECFPQFWNSLRRKKETFGPLVDCDFSFNNKRLCSLFLFVEHLLGILGKVNTCFQQRYLLIWEAWSIVSSLKKHLAFITTRLQSTDQSFPYLSSLDTDIKREFVLFVQRLDQSIDLRFPCPSQSIYKRNKKREPDDSSIQKSLKRLPPQNHCSISDLFAVFSFENQFDTSSSSFFSTHQELMNKIEQARRECEQILTSTQTECETRSPITDIVGFVVKIKRNLFDIFHFVPREKYPLLWDESVKLNTIIPTTVSCEQSFSVIKNTQHKNKSTVTVFANVTTKYQQTKEVMIL